MDAERLKWVELCRQIGNCSVAALECGVSRPTLRKWLLRHQQDGPEALASSSRRPNTSPVKKIGERESAWIAELCTRRLASRRIQSELTRTHGFNVSRTAIDRLLARNGTKPLARPKLSRNQMNRYAKEIPRERLQMGTCRTGHCYQYTAVDDCTRIRVLCILVAARGTCCFS
jgi:transposase